MSAAVITNTTVEKSLDTTSQNRQVHEVVESIVADMTATSQKKTVDLEETGVDKIDQTVKKNELEVIMNTDDSKNEKMKSTEETNKNNKDLIENRLEEHEINGSKMTSHLIEKSQEELSNMLRLLIANFCDQHFVKQLQRAKFLAKNFKNNSKTSTDEMVKDTNKMESDELSIVSKNNLLNKLQETEQIDKKQEKFTSESNENNIEDDNKIKITKKKQHYEDLDNTLSPPLSSSSSSSSSSSTSSSSNQFNQKDDNNCLLVDKSSKANDNNILSASSLSPPPSSSSSSSNDCSITNNSNIESGKLSNLSNEDNQPKDELTQPQSDKINNEKCCKQDTIKFKKTDQDVLDLEELEVIDDEDFESITIPMSSKFLSKFLIGADKLEIFGSIHVRSNNIRLLSCLIDEQLSIDSTLFNDSNLSFSSSASISSGSCSSKIKQHQKFLSFSKALKQRESLASLIKKQQQNLLRSNMMMNMLNKKCYHSRRLKLKIQDNHKANCRHHRQSTTGYRQSKSKNNHHHSNQNGKSSSYHKIIKKQISSNYHSSKNHHKHHHNTNLLAKRYSNKNDQNKMPNEDTMIELQDNQQMIHLKTRNKKENEQAIMNQKSAITTGDSYRMHHRYENDDVFGQEPQLLIGKNNNNVINSSFDNSIKSKKSKINDIFYNKNNKKSSNDLLGNSTSPIVNVNSVSIVNSDSNVIADQKQLVTNDLSDSSSAIMMASYPMKKFKAYHSYCNNKRKRILEEQLLKQQQELKESTSVERENKDNNDNSDNMSLANLATVAAAAMKIQNGDELNKEKNAQNVTSSKKSRKSPNVSPSSALMNEDNESELDYDEEDENEDIQNENTDINSNKQLKLSDESKTKTCTGAQNVTNTNSFIFDDDEDEDAHDNSSVISATSSSYCSPSNNKIISNKDTNLAISGNNQTIKNITVAADTQAATAATNSSSDTTETTRTKNRRKQQHKRRNPTINHESRCSSMSSSADALSSSRSSRSLVSLSNEDDDDSFSRSSLSPAQYQSHKNHHRRRASAGPAICTGSNIDNNDRSLSPTSSMRSSYSNEFHNNHQYRSYSSASSTTSNTYKTDDYLEDEDLDGPYDDNHYNGQYNLLKSNQKSHRSRIMNENNDNMVMLSKGDKENSSKERHHNHQHHGSCHGNLEHHRHNGYHRRKPQHHRNNDSLIECELDVNKMNSIKEANLSDDLVLLHQQQEKDKQQQISGVSSLALNSSKSPRMQILEHQQHQQTPLMSTRGREEEYLMRKYKRRFMPYNSNNINQQSNEPTNNMIDNNSNLYLLASSRQHHRLSSASGFGNVHDGNGMPSDSSIFNNSSVKINEDCLSPVNGNSELASGRDQINGDHHLIIDSKNQIQANILANYNGENGMNGRMIKATLHQSSDVLNGVKINEVTGSLRTNLSPSSSSSSSSSIKQQQLLNNSGLFHHNHHLHQQQHNPSTAAAVLAAAAAAAAAADIRNNNSNNHTSSSHHIPPPPPPTSTTSHHHGLSHHQHHPHHHNHHPHHAQSVAALLADMQQQQNQQHDVNKTLVSSSSHSSHHHATQNILNRFSNSNGSNNQNDLMAAVLAQQQQHRSMLDHHNGNHHNHHGHHHQNNGQNGNGSGNNNYAATAAALNANSQLYSRYSSHLNAAVAAAAAAAAAHSSAASASHSSSHRRANSVESDATPSPPATTPAVGGSSTNGNGHVSNSSSLSSSSSSSSSSSENYTNSKYNLHERNKDEMCSVKKERTSINGTSTTNDVSSNGCSNQNGNEKVRLVPGYDVFISTNDLNACNDDRGSATRLLRNLMDVFFDKSTLAKSSINGTGRITNTLDKHVISALFAYVKNRYVDVPHSQLTRAATDKCVQTRRNFRKKIKAAQSYFGMFPSIMISRPPISQGNENQV